MGVSPTGRCIRARLTSSGIVPGLNHIDLTMATSSLFALIDDIATLLDDVAVLTKVAATKTSGVIGDDLALNAQQVAGVNADRELPVVWAVAKGSFINKLILVPTALAISAVAAWLVQPLLMIGGAYLCFEGVEKLAHKWLHAKADDDAHHAQLTQAVANEKIDMVAFEKDKIRGAIRTDFVLSAEIIVITLGTVAAATFTKQLTVLSLIALGMTVGVYGVVAGIVKLDDLGLALTQRANALAQSAGKLILALAPYLMKTLSVVGTAAMFLVGGSILAEGIPALHHAIEGIGRAVGGGLGGGVSTLFFHGLVGIIAGALVLGAVHLVKRIRGQ